MINQTFADWLFENFPSFPDSTIDSIRFDANSVCPPTLGWYNYRTKIITSGLGIPEKLMKFAIPGPGCVNSGPVRAFLIGQFRSMSTSQSQSTVYAKISNSTPVAELKLDTHKA
ncbi:hypothetical protein L873DRAFT_156099 [Choiromyces venosus 120613-1]|uniref:Uncharacterized protein n=1 Tax=Choiromyces venosus 120613-1 TaxID=1336337 RepID=A0A3N4J7Q8_9PEZI|nr:hypothetical protein L873DRAFT_156099 [Choiromyces venosus 120613-1]